MKLLACVKRVIDPYVKVRVKADESAVETENIKMAINPFCQNAVEEALRWRDAGKATEVVALSVGSAAVVETLRTALAMGADRGVHIEAGEGLEPLAVAKLIAAVVRKEEPGAVWMGKQGIDGDYNQTGQMTSALLGWGQALFLSRAEIDGDEVLAESETDDGIGVLRIKLPCVLTADLRLNEARFPTLPNIMNAKKKPMEKFTPEDLGVDIAPRLRMLKVSEPPRRKAGRKVADVAELVDVLRNESKVIP